MVRGILRGIAAGAAATTALNAVTYLDMAIRGRPASGTPERTVEAIAGRIGHPVPGEGEVRQNRLSGLGALSGLATGITIGAVYGVLRAAGLRLPAVPETVLIAAGTMAATDLPMARLSVTDPGTWSAADRLSDAVPHLAYAVVVRSMLARPSGR
jgi:hypothetical protein